MNKILHIAIQQIAKISILLNPIIPKKTLKVLNALKIDKKSVNLDFLNKKNILSKTLTIGDLDILFKKIS